MRFKLDENLPVELANVFREAGHDAVTVLDQNLMGARNPGLCVGLHARGTGCRHARYGFCGHPDVPARSLSRTCGISAGVTAHPVLAAA